MLQSHINAIEKVLLAQSQTAKNAGHPNLRGGPREWFVRDFLRYHLPSTLEIGQGEILDVNSAPNPSPGQYRPQVDVVLYRKDLPKISYSATDAAYFVEGVMAVIESKSVITEDELTNVNIAAIKHSKLMRAPFSGFAIGKPHEKIITYIVAFDGPQSMKTVAGWLNRQVSENSWSIDEMVDMIVVLGKGVLWKLSTFPELTIPQATTTHHWAYIDQEDKNLLTLFIHILTWSAASSSPPNMLGYVAGIQLNNIHLN